MKNALENKEIIRMVREFAEINSLEDDIHGFEHVKRVYDLCVKIGKQCGADLFVLKLAALLHDIGRIYEYQTNSSQNHAELSAQKALEFFKSINLNISSEEIDNIIHSIRSHSFSNNITPNTLEAKILSDVDKLDALGAIGLYRTIGFTAKAQGNLQDVLKHLQNKILKLKSRMMLKITESLANKRHKIIERFYKELISEI
jgi:uncharacterized protein